MKKLFRNNFLFLIAAILLVIVGIFVHENDTSNDESIIKRFEAALHKKEILLENELEKISLDENYSRYEKLFTETGISFLIYRNDSLVFWTGNNIFSSNYSFDTTTVCKLKTGWYKAKIKKTGNLTCVGLLLIKNDYPYQNDYLKNSFSSGLWVVKKADVHNVAANKPGLIVKDKSGKNFCKLEIIDNSPIAPYKNWLSYLLYSIAIFLIITFFYNECENYSKTIGSLWPSFVFLFTIITLRFLTMYLHFPESIYETDLFGPRYFADANSYWLTSLGDFLVNSILLLYIAYYLYKKIKPKKSLEKINGVVKLTLTVAVFMLLCRLSWEINTLFVGLIRNSSIPFNINNLFSLSSQSYIGLVILSCLFLCFVFISYALIRVVIAFRIKTILTIATMVLAFIIHTAWWHMQGRLDLVAIMWGFGIIVAIFLLQKKNEELFPFGAVVIMLFWISLYSVHTFLKHNRLKEFDLRVAYAEKLSVEKDPVAEHIFTETENDLFADTILHNLFIAYPINYKEVEKRLLQQYFSGYWERYDMSVSIFDSLCYPVLNSGFYSADNNFHLDNLIDSKGEKTLSDNFYYIPDDGGKINYLAKLPIKKNKNQTPFATIYIDFKSRLATDEIGFPELLLDKSVEQNTELRNYSYAKYKSGHLVNHFGKLAYPAKCDIFEVGENKKTVLNLNGYNHVITKTENEGLVVISKESVKVLDEVTIFSYLFAFYSLLLLVVISMRQLTSAGKVFKAISFKNKLQVLLISVVLVSLLLFGAGTVYFIQIQFDNKSHEIISEKIRSVQIEVQNKLDGANENNFRFNEYASYILKKFSNVFFTDITLYDLQGNLIASSKPKLFEEGLLPGKMNYKAYHEMAVKGQTEFINDESIGSLNYHSAYLPFVDKRGRVLGYLNLPYFAKQSELEKEISAFLVALINVYVLLFALTVLVAIFFSNYLTRPLRIIQDKMSTITLGKTNEFIEWNQKDEIGNLVSEYNRMIVELSKSAELLARSERELAWREMAKQVAHEIKNPLTPMKLSIQHLKKIWKDKSPDIDEKVEGVTKMLVEQIDTLTTIANEFSNFAKMPKANNEKINLKNILDNIVELYKDSANILPVEAPVNKDAMIVADKEQLLRVFNNLVKNAIQAIPEGREGRIELKIKIHNGQAIASVKDNGTGINETAIDKIFMPNFTTKTAGMGLGLAMVKNIVETSGGKIWFETTKEIGTTFYVSLPLAQ